MLKCARRERERETHAFVQYDIIMKWKPAVELARLWMDVRG